MSKLILIYNFAPRYRAGIFKLIDQAYDCHWFFGRNNTDIKGLDLSILEEVTEVDNKIVLRAPLYWQRGVVSQLWKQDEATFFVLGDLFCLSTWTMAILRKLFFRKKRFYYWSHGWYGKEGSLKRIIKKIFFKLADGTFLYGNYAKELMLKEGFKDSELFVIHNSLDYDRQLPIRQSLQPTPIYKKHFGNERPTLIFIGRLTEVKRLDLLLQALAILKEKGQLYNLVLVGDGVERSNLQAQAERDQLSEQVWFYGPCYDERANAELIYNADLCVSPGNVGLTAIHTMMFGTPVITHDCFKYQMPEFEAIHKGTTGDFFTYGSAESIAETITNWFSKHQADRESVRQACFNEIDQSWTPAFQLNVIQSRI